MERPFLLMAWRALASTGKMITLVWVLSENLTLDGIYRRLKIKIDTIPTICMFGMHPAFTEAT